MYGNSLPGYDAWLERPYTDAAQYEDDIEQAIIDLGLTEEQAETYDFDAYFEELYAEQDEAMYADYLEMSNDIAEAYLPDSLDA